MTGWMKVKGDDGVFAALIALVAALLPAHFAHEGAVALFFDPPNISQPSALENHVVQSAHVGKCTGLRGQTSLRCFRIITTTGVSLQMGNLNESQMRILEVVQPKLAGETVTVGYWRVDRPRVMSVALGRQLLVDYSDRREVLVRESMIKFILGIVSLAGIIGVFAWRMTHLVSNSAMDTE